MVRIFLAHAKEDKDAVIQLYDRLQQQGYKPWLDKKDLLGGQLWDDEIKKAIDSSDIFIACLSNRSVEKRGYVQKEFRMALQKCGDLPEGKIFLIPLRLDNCDIPNLRQREYGINIRDYQWIDYFEDDGFKQLVKTINHHFPSAARPQIVGSNEQSEIVDNLLKIINLGKGVDLELVHIPAGTFQMGEPTSEKKDDMYYERPQHKVTVPEFWMGKFPVTQAQYEAVMDNNPSRFPGTNYPVETVSWYDAVAFCEKASKQTGMTLRLPSEAEWEYACRAGTTTPFHFGKTITIEQANYSGMYNKTTFVGCFSANAFGLYDMHGNVREWCQDHWHENYKNAPQDGSPWINGGDANCRVLRGGSWAYPCRFCCSAYRYFATPGNRSSTFGLRVVCSVPKAL